MNIAPDLRTLRNGKTFSKSSHSGVSVRIPPTLAHRATQNASKNSEILHELIEERLKANLEPLNEQISTLTQLLNQLIQENLSRNSSTADTPTQARRPPSHEAGTSRALSAREIGSTGSPQDTEGTF